MSLYLLGEFLADPHLVFATLFVGAAVVGVGLLLADESQSTGAGEQGKAARSR